MQQTSILAFLEVQPKLSERQAAVLEAIEEHGPVNNRELAEYLAWPVNCITPRCLELRRKGKVECAYVGADISGRKTNFWRAVA